MYLMLIEHHQVNGTFTVREEDNAPLCNWLQVQRARWRVAHGQKPEKRGTGTRISEKPIPKWREQLMDEIDFPWVATKGRFGTLRWTDEAKNALLDVMRKHRELRPGGKSRKQRELTAAQRWNRVRELAPFLHEFNDKKLAKGYHNYVKPQIEKEEHEKNKASWNVYRKKW